MFLVFPNFCGQTDRQTDTHTQYDDNFQTLQGERQDNTNRWLLNIMRYELIHNFYYNDSWKGRQIITKKTTMLCIIHCNDSKLNMYKGVIRSAITGSLLLGVLLVLFSQSSCDTSFNTTVILSSYHLEVT